MARRRTENAIWRLRNTSRMMKHKGNLGTRMSVDSALDTTAIKVIVGLLVQDLSIGCICVTYTHMRFVINTYDIYTYIVYT